MNAKTDLLDTQSNNGSIIVAERSQVEPTRLPVRFDAESLIAKAIESGLPVETMERLLAMRTQLKAESAKEAFFAALAGFQGELPIIKKSKTAKVKTRTGGEFTYHYAALDDIVRAVGPLFKKWDLSYTIVTRVEAGNPAFFIAETRVHHAMGHSEASEFRVPIDQAGRMNAAQEYGSAGTYAKRYSFCNALGILTGDDDDDATTTAGQYQSAEPPINQALHRAVILLLGKGVTNSKTMDEFKSATQQINTMKELVKPADLAHLREVCARQKGVLTQSVDKETGEIKAAAHPQDTTEQYITAAQLKRLNAMIGEQKLNRDHIKAALKAQVGIDSTKDILKADYEDICAKLQELSDFGATLAKEETA